MNVGALGEFELIRRIERLTADLSGRGVVLGIGDDAALLRVPKGRDLVVTTDAAVEGVHFRFDHESPTTAGRRAMAANLSDLAAMGATPLAFTLALSLPARTELRTALGLVRGLLREARAFDCPLVGGNLTRAREISLVVTAHGSVRRGRALRRSNARAGDRLFVTGTLGRSAQERGRGRIRTVPTARVEAGQALARLASVGGCLDVSDGLIADLGHLARASGEGALLRAADVPRPRGCPELLALTGGEDLELLFSVRPAGPDARSLSSRLGVPVSEIGRIQPGEGVQVETADGRSITPGPGGWRHF
jgi:thiamine-monophosphate kinase